MIFAREGCAPSGTSPRRIVLFARRAFSSLFLVLLAVLLFFLFLSLFFFHRAAVAERARAAFRPRGPRRFFFSSVCAATPPRHNGRVPENSSLGRRPFPRPPRLFRRLPSRLGPLSRVPSSTLDLTPPAFFLAAFFFVPATPTPPPPAADVDVDPAIPPSPLLARSPLSPASPQGCILRGTPRPGPSWLPRDTTLYTILEARNVCARLWPGVYTAAVWRSIMPDA